MALNLKPGFKKVLHTCIFTQVKIRCKLTSRNGAQSRLSTSDVTIGVTSAEIILVRHREKISDSSRLLGLAAQVNDSTKLYEPGDLRPGRHFHRRHLPHRRAADRWRSDNDGWKSERGRRTRQERQTDVMSVCTFLPQLAETPVEQSQDKANEYGLDRLQYGWLEGRREGGGGRRRRRGHKKKSAGKSTKTNMEDGAATAGGGGAKE